jgi:hypothetical protein
VPGILALAGEIAAKRVAISESDQRTGIGALMD